MKVLGYIITIVGIIILTISGKVQHWKNDGIPLWLHIILEIVGFIMIGIGVALIKSY